MQKKNKTRGTKPKKEIKKQEKPAKTPKKTAKWIGLYSRKNKNELKWVSCSNCGYIMSKDMADNIDTCPICRYHIQPEENETQEEKGEE